MFPGSSPLVPVPASRVIVLLLLLASPLPAQITLQNDTVLAVDSVEPGSLGPYTLLHYDLDGTLLGTLLLDDAVGAETPSGLAMLDDGTVLITGSPGEIIARVDLDTGVLFDPFDAQIITTDLTAFDGNILAVNFQGDIYTYAPDGTVESVVTLGLDIDPTGIDTDGTFLYIGSFLDGNLYVFDLDGDLIDSISTPIPGGSIAALDYLPETATFLLSLGFGTDEIVEVDWGGNIIDSFPSGFPLVGGVQRIEIAPPVPPLFIRGDADGSGSFTGLVDGFFILNFQFVAGSPAPPCLDAADADDSGTFSGLVDGFYVLNFQFVSGSPPPPAPGAMVCGPDLSADALDCATHPCF